MTTAAAPATGHLSQWDDTKGYGFITPDGGGPKLFVHAKAFGLRPHRPYVGERLSFTEAHDAQGKRRAVSVQGLAPRPVPPQARPRDGGQVLLLVPAFAGFVLACRLIWGLPHWVWGLYSAMSMATFIVYFLDKRAAARGDWRVAENTLHGLSLACGWPGALLAQQLLRHKSSKAPFRQRYWLTVGVNIAAFVALFTPLLR
ncbi:DUF1294 domain-containing protein [Pelomonas sp. HMWF004]|nr:DUF1294 domain-containing protein [Pelomonas sp. HMWF004]